MKRATVWLCVFLCGLSTVADAQDRDLGSSMTLEQLKTQTTDRRERRPPVLTVSPAAEPRPALKYRFQPTIWEKRPANAMMHYMRVNTILLDHPQESWQKYESDVWQEKDHPDAPTAAELAEAVQQLDSVFAEIHQLALSEDADWDHRIRELQGPEVYQYLLPDVQQTRRLARFLNLRVRDQLNRDDIEGAIGSIRDGLQLARFVSNDELIIQQLVGIAIAAIMSERISELIQHPDCPNLYWALATLPRPLVSNSDSLQWELHAIHQVLPMLSEAETEVWTEDESLQAWSTMIESLHAVGALNDSNLSGSAVTLTAMGMTQGHAARERLRSHGFSGRRLAQMPDVQCVLADASLEIAQMTDDIAKALLLPYTISEAVRRQSQDDYRQWVRSAKPSVASLIGRHLMPAARNIKEAELRTHLRFNRLMTLEALRMHAAEHDGQLPDTLNDLSPVPAMRDPYTGRHFDYRTESDDDGTVIVLEAAGPTTWRPLRELRFRLRP